MISRDKQVSPAAGTPNAALRYDPSRPPLKVAVVGAGIGGLTAAIGFRRAGHQVDIFEQSRSANEVGAAVHLAPNSNGILRRWGIHAEQFGACTMSGLTERQHDGTLVRRVDLTIPNKQWQHPWHLVHRVALHDELKRVATSKTGLGSPARLQHPSKVVRVDPETGTITLETGITVTADIVVGADGVYSKTRRYVTGTDSKLFSSGKAAFRFLIPRSVVDEDPITKPIVANRDSLSIWYGKDRRVVMYPCNNNAMLNFVLIHPEAESQATLSDEWDKTATIEQVLKVFHDFDPALKKLIGKVKPGNLKVWQLLDMEKLPSWTKGKLVLVGDAAHPLTPHQGQGAGQAIEDAAALTTVLPQGTLPVDVPERLRLYEEIRAGRAHTIQEYSRQAGKDWVDGRPQVDMMAYTNYNFGHDECDNSNNIFSRWLWSKHQKGDQRGIYTAFGPFASLLHEQPRLISLGRGTFTTMSIRFKTSRTYLQTIFPTKSFTFKEPGTVCLAEFCVTKLQKLPELGGGGYSRFGLYIHGVQYRRQDGSLVDGAYLPVLFEDLTDSTFGGLEGAGMPKLFCDIDVDQSTDGYRMKASWRGTTFAELAVNDLKDDARSYSGGLGCDILAYRRVTAVGDPWKADIEYGVVGSGDWASKDEQSTIHSVAGSVDSSVKIGALDWQSVPTLYHVVSFLAEIPIYEVVDAMVVHGSGGIDTSPFRRIE